MTHSPFQPTQRAFVKHVLVLFVIILALIPVVKAEEKSWYEIDGIRFRPVGFFENKKYCYRRYLIVRFFQTIPDLFGNHSTFMVLRHINLHSCKANSTSAAINKWLKL